MADRAATNIIVSFRADDKAVVVSTDAYVSHKKGAGPWRSTFSMTLGEAAKMRDSLNAMLDDPNSYYQEVA